MMKISCILVLSSVLYGVWACDSKAEAPFKTNAMNLADFYGSDLVYDASSSTNPELKSATLKNGQRNADGSMASHFKGTDKSGNPVNFQVTYTQKTGESCISGVGYLNDTKAVNTYCIARVGSCQATYVCNSKGYSTYTVTHFDGQVCSDDDYKKCEAIIKQSNPNAPLKKF